METNEILNFLRNHKNDLAQDNLDPIFKATNRWDNKDIAEFLIDKLGFEIFIGGFTKIPNLIFNVIDDKYFPEDLIIPKNIESIDQGAFTAIPIKTLKFEEGCKYIGNFAFQNCNNLTEITLSKSLNQIEETAFGQRNLYKFKFFVPANSYAESWCKENNLNYTILK